LEFSLAKQERNGPESDQFGLTPADYADIDARGLAFLDGEDDGFVEISRHKLQQTMSALEAHINAVGKAARKRRG
jgi:hypothetical protein